MRLFLLTLVCFIAAIAIMAASCERTGNNVIGEPCDEKADCESGFCLHEERYGEKTGWSDGYCSDTCSGSCSEGICVDLAGESYCLSECEDDQSCRVGYLCDPLRTICLPDCREGWDCGDGYTCDENGHCIYEPGTYPLGEGCTSDEDCESDYCLEETITETGVVWAGGICTQECDGECPDGFACSPIGDGSNVCLAACEDDNQCREAYVCEPNNGACVPDCRAGATCPSGSVCNSNGVCGPAN